MPAMPSVADWHALDDGLGQQLTGRALLNKVPLTIRDNMDSLHKARQKGATPFRL